MGHHCLFLCVEISVRGGKCRFQKGKVLIMEIYSFVMKVEKAIAERLGAEYRVEVQEIQKNNNVLLQGLLIHSKEQNVSPTIYLNSFWDAYERGIPFSVIIEKILSIYEEDTPKRNVDMSFFKCFER